MNWERERETWVVGGDQSIKSKPTVPINGWPHRTTPQTTSRDKDLPLCIPQYSTFHLSNYVGVLFLGRGLLLIWSWHPLFDNNDLIINFPSCIVHVQHCPSRASRFDLCALRRRHSARAAMEFAGIDVGRGSIWSQLVKILGIEVVYLSSIGGSICWRYWRDGPSVSFGERSANGVAQK